MIVKFNILGWRFTFSMAPTTKVIGVHSTLPNDEHILMWDFDHIDYWQVHDELLKIQLIYKLPTIHIMATSPRRGFHAWCFKRVSFKKLVEILAFTKNVDWNYFKYGVYRGKFTLRVYPKEGREIVPIKLLKTNVPDDATIVDLKHWVEYETLSDRHKSGKLEISIIRSEKK